MAEYACTASASGEPLIFLSFFPHINQKRSLTNLKKILSQIIHA
jgi:hypothetical protein